MYRMILCEKPSVAQTVAYSLGANERVADGKVSYYEGNGLIVTNAVGHIIGIGMPEDYGWEKWNLSDLPLMPQFRTTRHLIGIKELELNPGVSVDSSVGCVIPSLVTWSRRELTPRQWLLRELLQFLLTEGVILALAFAFPGIDTSRPAVVLGIAGSVLVIYLLVFLLSWAANSAEARRTDRELQAFQRLHSADEL